MNEIEKIQKAFLWKNSKIKHETLCNDYKAGGLKNVDIANQIIALRQEDPRQDDFTIILSMNGIDHALLN